MNAEQSESERMAEHHLTFEISQSRDSDRRSPELHISVLLVTREIEKQSISVSDSLHVLPV